MLEHNGINAIDETIEKISIENLNALTTALPHLSEEELLNEINNLASSCDKDELIKVVKLLINIWSKSFEN